MTADVTSPPITHVPVQIEWAGGLPALTRMTRLFFEKYVPADAALAPAHAAGILDRLQNGSMPCDGAWPQDWIEVFERWTATQMLP